MHNHTLADIERADIERLTLAWVEQFVVGLNLCPFANSVVKSGELSIFVEPEPAFEAVLASLVQQCDALQRAAEQATVLFVVPNGFDEFDTYLDLVDIAEALLVDVGFEGVLQIASFHPHYQFDGSAMSDVANYTNRSPYPMLHLLKEAAVEQAIEKHADTDAIAQRNIDLLRSMSVEKLTSLVTSEYKQHDN